MAVLFAALLLSVPVGPAPPTFEPRSPPVHDAKTDDRYSTIAFDPKDDAQAQLEFKLDGINVTGKKLLIVMGGNWCHDSAALANLLDSPSFVGMITQHFDVLFVDVGKPQIGRGRNLDIAARFGIRKVKGTPTVLVVSPEGKLLNSRRDALSWRNAASRDPDEVHRALAQFADAE